MSDKSKKDIVSDSLRNSIANLKKVANQVNQEGENLQINKTDTESTDNKTENENIILTEKIEIPMNEEPKQKEDPPQIPAPQPPANDYMVIYNNPMTNLIQQYADILKNIEEQEKNIMSGFIKKPPQSEIYVNPTIQVRRDLYTCICKYITEMKMGKTKILNEIFMLGVQEFIKKYSENHSE